MKPADWFKVGVRLFGMWLLIQFVEEIVSLAEVEGRLVEPRTTTPTAYVFHGAVYLLVACLLLFGATPLANLFDWEPEHEAPAFPVSALPNNAQVGEKSQV